MTIPIVRVADEFESMGLSVDRTHLDSNKLMATDGEEVFWCHLPSRGGANHGLSRARKLADHEKGLDIEEISPLALTRDVPSWEPMDFDLWGLFEGLDVIDELGRRAA